MEAAIPIDQLTDKNQPWNAIITVEEKLQSIQSPKSPTNFQKFVFSDAQGVKVEGIMFDLDIERMSSKLQVFKKYRISNAQIRPLDEKYCREGIKVQWVISSKTVIQEITEPKNMLQLDCTYTKFGDLNKFLDDKTQPIDLLAVLVDVLPVKVVTTPNGKSRVQKFVLINEKFQSVFLSMWNQMLDIEGKELIESLTTFPVIICRRLRANYYNGVELTTFFDTAVLVNPPDKDAYNLKDWVAMNQKVIKEFVDQKFYLKNQAANFLQDKEKLTLIANLLPTEKFGFVKARVSFEHIMQRFWYMACQKCFSSTAAGYASEYNCNSCGESQSAQPRCRLEVQLTDDSGSINACMFGDQAEEILEFDALDAMTNSEEKLKMKLADVHKELAKKIFFVHIKQAKLRADDSLKRYTIVQLVNSEKNETDFNPTVIESGSSSSHAKHSQQLEEKLSQDSETHYHLTNPEKKEDVIKARRSLIKELADTSKGEDGGNLSAADMVSKKRKH